MATQVERVPNNTGLMIGPYMRSTVRFSVEENFKGADTAEVVFELDYCGYSFTQGERYLVYAHRNRNNNQLDVRDGGTRTRLLSEASEDLEYLRSLPTASPGSRIFGTVAVPTHNIRESRYTAEPLRDIKVILEGSDERRETVTDEEGNYQFTGLPAGTYRVRAEIPAHLRYAEQTVTVTGRECVPLHIPASRNAQIAGRVLDVNNQPVMSVPVSLVSADASLEDILSENRERDAWTFSVTNEQGRFGFSQLAPGRYLLIINRAEFERTRGTERSRSLPRIFYPGVSDRGQATVIVVSESQTAQEHDFHLPPE